MATITDITGMAITTHTTGMAITIGIVIIGTVTIITADVGHRRAKPSSFDLRDGRISSTMDFGTSEGRAWRQSCAAVLFDQKSESAELVLEEK